MARRALDGNPPITTTFKQPGYGVFGYHAGYDYGVKEWSVKAPEAGKIVAVYRNRENVDGGNIVELLSGSYHHRMLHMKSISVEVGQQVSEGQTLGVSGNTGNVGYHLHHDVRKPGTAWNHSINDYYDWEAIIKGQGDDMFNEGDRVNVNKALFGEDKGFWKEFVEKRSYKDAVEVILVSPEYMNESRINPGDAKNLEDAGMNKQATINATGKLWKNATYQDFMGYFGGNSDFVEYNGKQLFTKKG